MRSRRFIFISMLVVFLVAGISLGSARALDFDDYVDTWYNTKFKIKAVCEEFLFSQLFKASPKDNAWIYIESYNDVDGEFAAYLVTLDEDGITWQATAITLLTQGGTADDAILELDSAIDIIDGSTGDVVSILSFFVRLTGKEKDMALKSAKLQSISGASTVDVGIAFCYGLLQFKGKLKALAKVPIEVFNAVFPP